MQKKLLGLIAGNGKFPILFAQRARTKNFKVIAAGIQGDTSFFLRFFVDKFMIFKVGELQKLFHFLKNEGVREAIMAGQVNPENLFEHNVALDEEFKKLFVALNDRKADTIFKAIAERLKVEGIELMDSTIFLKDSLAPKGTLTRRGPTLIELQDIEFGKIIAKMMGALDVGQTVVVKEKAIVAIEAMEGTDQTILRGGKIAQEGAVIVKMGKPNQDLRFDVPVIGPRTIQMMIKSRSSCLAIEAEKTLLIDRKTCINLADKAGICIVAT